MHGRVIGVDPDVDLAVIAAATHDAAPDRLGDEGAAELGTPVFALADPGGRGLRVTLGLVAAAPRPVRGPPAGASPARSSTPRRCPAAPPAARSSTSRAGCSASTPSASRAASSSRCPADAAMRARVDALCRGEAAERPRLGLALARPRNRADGLVVRAVQDASPAAVAGIAPRRPRSSAVEGRPLRSVDDLVRRRARPRRAR